MRSISPPSVPDMTTDRPARPVIRLDGLALRTLAAAHELANDQDTARHLGISPSTLSRGLHGGTVGGRFVAATLHAFPDVTFADLFSVSLHQMQIPDGVALHHMQPQHV